LITSKTCCQLFGDTAIAALIVQEWNGTDWHSITGNIGSDNNAPAVFAIDDDGSGTPDLGSAYSNTTLNDEM
jgi:3-oxoacyl-[acyl-carrier-protein] synthase III